MRPLNRFGPSQVVAPFGYQPTRQGLRGGFGRLGASQYSSPVGQGAGKGAETGAQEGAAVGSVIPVIGTAVGTIVGAIAGAIAGSIGKVDPEIQNLDAAVNLYRANPGQLAQIANKYLVLAGWFDLEPNQVTSGGSNHPVYSQYGRMGEVNFAHDLAMLLYNAGQSGQITASDTPQTIYNRIVLPWINSFGKGQEVDNVNPGFIPTLIQGLIIDYLTGYWRNAWRARSGDTPSQFSSIPMFSLPAASPAAAAPPTTSVNPVGSAVTPTVNPAQLVATPPAAGSSVQYAPDYSQNGQPLALPAGLTFSGTDQYNGSWVLRNTANGALYVLWQGALEPYTSSMFAPASSVSTATTPVATTKTPAQLVATPPAVGATVQYAPDMAQSGAALSLPSGMVFEGSDPYNGSWVLQNPANGQLYTLWQGSIVPYTSSLFAPTSATSATSSAPVVTGSGTTGVNTGTVAPTTTTGTTAAAPTTSTASMGWVLGLAIAGTLLLAGKPKGRHRRAR